MGVVQSCSECFLELLCSLGLRRVMVANSSVDTTKCQKMLTAVGCGPAQWGSLWDVHSNAVSSFPSPTPPNASVVCSAPLKTPEGIVKRIREGKETREIPPEISLQSPNERKKERETHL